MRVLSCAALALWSLPNTHAFFTPVTVPFTSRVLSTTKPDDTLNSKREFSLKMAADYIDPDAQPSKKEQTLQKIEMEKNSALARRAEIERELAAVNAEKAKLVSETQKIKSEVEESTTSIKAETLFVSKEPSSPSGTEAEAVAGSDLGGLGSLAPFAIAPIIALVGGRAALQGRDEVKEEKEAELQSKLEGKTPQEQAILRFEERQNKPAKIVKPKISELRVESQVDIPSQEQGWAVFKEYLTELGDNVEFETILKSEGFNTEEKAAMSEYLQFQIIGVANWLELKAMKQKEKKDSTFGDETPDYDVLKNFSCIKTALQSKFSDLPLWQDAEKWYDPLYDMLAQKDAASVQEEEVQDWDEPDVRGLYRRVRPDLLRINERKGGIATWDDLQGKDLESMCKELMAETKYFSNPLEERVKIILNHAGMGRDGEIKFLKWNRINWDLFFMAPVVEWTQVKTLSTKDVYLVTDYDSYHFDIYHALGSWFAAEDGLTHSDPTHSNFVFPTLQKVPDSKVKDKITETLLRLSATSLNKKTKASSIRKGAHTSLATNKYISEDQQKILSGYTRNENSSIGSVPALVYPPCLALAGWQTPPGLVYPPRLDCIGDANKNRLTALMDNLFDANIPAFKPDGHLYILLKTCTASMIVNHNRMATEYPASKVVQKMRESCKKARITEAELMQWGDAIGKDFSNSNVYGLQNVLSQESIGGLRDDITWIRTLVQDERFQNNKRQQETLMMSKQLIDINDGLNELMSILSDDRVFAVVDPSELSAIRPNQVRYGKTPANFTSSILDDVVNDKGGSGSATAVLERPAKPSTNRKKKAGANETVSMAEDITVSSTLEKIDQITVALDKISEKFDNPDYDKIVVEEKDHIAVMDKIAVLDKISDSIKSTGYQNITTQVAETIENAVVDEKIITEEAEHIENTSDEKIIAKEAGEIAVLEEIDDSIEESVSDKIKDILESPGSDKVDEIVEDASSENVKIVVIYDFDVLYYFPQSFP